MTNAFLIATLLAARFSFDDGKAGQPPAGFEATATLKGSPGKWVLRKDGGGFVLAQEDKTDDRFAAAVVVKSSFRDVRLSARVKTLGGYQGAGVVWRYKDPNHYYVARINPEEGNVRVDVVIEGKRRKLGMADLKDLKTGIWHTLAVEHKGAAITVKVGDKVVIEAKDETLAEAGRVGLWIKDDTLAQFDDLDAEEQMPAAKPAAK